MKNLLKEELNPSILNDFLNYLIAVKNFSIGTVEGYSIDLRYFFKFLKAYYNLTDETSFDLIDITDIDIFLLKRVKSSDIEAFLFALSYNKSLMVNTRNRKIYSINSFYNWLIGYFPTVILKNPVLTIQKIPNVQKFPKYLSIEKCKKIINIFNENNSKNYARDNLIIKVFLTTGLRVSELINIKMGDVNIFKKEIIVLGKGNKERTIFLNTSTATAIKKYIDQTYNNHFNSKMPLFLNNKKQKFTRRQIEYIMEKAYKYAGLEEYGYTVHTLRHTFATLMYMNGKTDILILKKLLGHTSISATEIYTHVYDEQIKNAIDKNPLNNVA